jgi:hypothetical protein
MPKPAANTNGGSGTPRWVIVQGALVTLFVLVVVAMSTGLLNTGLLGLTGGHTPPGGIH